MAQPFEGGVRSMQADEVDCWRGAPPGEGSRARSGEDLSLRATGASVKDLYAEVAVAAEPSQW